MEACWAHNPEVRRSKLRSARILLNFSPFLSTNMLTCTDPIFWTGVALTSGLSLKTLAVFCTTCMKGVINGCNHTVVGDTQLLNRICNYNLSCFLPEHRARCPGRCRRPASSAPWWRRARSACRPSPSRSQPDNVETIMYWFNGSPLLKCNLLYGTKSLQKVPSIWNLNSASLSTNPR